MKTLVIAMLAIYVSSISAHASDDCNSLLSDRLASAIHDLAKLRFNLDTQMAKGESNLILNTLKRSFDQKRNEILKSGSVVGLTAEALDQKVIDHMPSVQSVDSFAVAELAQLLQEQNKNIIEVVSTNPLIEKRFSAGACRVSDHEVLIAGGLLAGPADRYRSALSIELYNLKTGKSGTFGHLIEAGQKMQLIPISDQKVFLCGGYPNLTTPQIIDLTTREITALNYELNETGQLFWLPSERMIQLDFDSEILEVLDLKTGMHQPLSRNLLPGIKIREVVQQSDGGIVIVARAPIQRAGDTLVFRMDPNTLEVKKIGEIPDAPSDFALISLNDHQIILSGGVIGRVFDARISKKVLMYDLNTNKTTSLGKLIRPRKSHKMVLLSGRRLMIAGGYGPGEEAFRTVEIFNLDTGTSSEVGEASAEGSDITTVKTAEGVLLIGTGLTLDFVKVGVH